MKKQQHISVLSKSEMPNLPSNI